MIKVCCCSSWGNMMWNEVDISWHSISFYGAATCNHNKADDFFHRALFSFELKILNF